MHDAHKRGLESRHSLIQLTGGKRFSRDVQPTDKNGNPVGLWRVRWNHLVPIQYCGTRRRS